MTGLSLVPRRSGVDVRSGVGDTFGTFGELLQGALPDGADFLVTFPITRCSRAWFRFDLAGPLRVFPSHKVKSLRLAEAMLAACGPGAGGTLVLDSDLPIGKGLASSSADLVATARAVGGVLGLDTSPEAIERWLRPIEPTDGVMYPGIVAFEHRAVRLRSVLGILPASQVVAVDEGGHFDTIGYNKRPKCYSDFETAEYAALLQSLTDAVHDGDLPAVGDIATRSTVLNQRLAPKRNLSAMLHIASDVGALGVVCTHSGTMLGLLLAEGDADHRRRLATARTACTALPGVTTVFRALTFHDMDDSHAA
jgi:L-threonine kinase